MSCLAVPGKVIANTAPVTSLIQDSDMSNNSARAEGIAWVELPIKCSPDIVSTKQVVNYPPPNIRELARRNQRRLLAKIGVEFSDRYDER